MVSRGLKLLRPKEITVPPWLMLVSGAVELAVPGSWSLAYWNLASLTMREEITVAREKVRVSVFTFELPVWSKAEVVVGVPGAAEFSNAPPTKF